MRYLFLLLPLIIFASQLQTRTQMLMGTFVDISLEKESQQYIGKSFKLIKEIESQLSSYAKDADVYILNHTKSVSTSPYLQEALEKSLLYYVQTNGYFDISIGSVTKNLYHFGEGIASPSKKELKSAQININAIKINAKNIHLEENITIDLGGMGKGFAVDKVANFLLENNVSNGIIALSGDIRCLNRCEVGIQSPFRSALFATLHTKVPNIAISTSGTYRRYAAKKEEHHLIDPKQKMPQKNFLSVSLFSVGDNSRLDAYATAISVMPKLEALNFLKLHSDISYILIHSDRNVTLNIDEDAFILHL